MQDTGSKIQDAKYETQDTLFQAQYLYKHINSLNLLCFSV